MTIDDKIRELIAETYEMELFRIFQDTSATFNWTVQTGGGCQALVVENVANTNFDIVIVQNLDVPYCSEYDNPISVSIARDFQNACPNQVKEWRMETLKLHKTHEQAFEHIAQCRDLILQMADDEKLLFRVDWVHGYGEVPHKIMTLADLQNPADGWDLDDDFLSVLRNSTLGACNSWAAMGEQIDFTKIMGDENE